MKRERRRNRRLITRRAAIEILRRRALPRGWDTVFSAFALRRMLRPGDVVCPAFDREHPQPGADELHMETPSWFAFIDLFPTARYAHPVVYAFVDARTGRVRTHHAKWWPLLNGRELYSTDIERERTPDRFAPIRQRGREALEAFTPFSSADATDVLPEDLALILDEGPAPGGAGPEDISAAEEEMEERPEPWIFEGDRPRHLADVAEKDPCRGKVRRKIAILIQAGPDESIKKDVDRMKQALGRIGFIGWTIKYKKGKRLSSVRSFLARYLATAPDAPGPCDKLLLYISGHGKSGYIIWGPKETPKGAGTDNYWWYNPSNDFDWSKGGRRRRVPHSIPGLLGLSSAGYINVVIDACHSGGVIPHMITQFTNDNKSRARITVGTAASRERESQALPRLGRCLHHRMGKRPAEEDTGPQEKGAEPPEDVRAGV